MSNIIISITVKQMINIISYCRTVCWLDVYKSWKGFHMTSPGPPSACTSPVRNGHLRQVSPKQRLLQVLTDIDS